MAEDMNKGDSLSRNGIHEIVTSLKNNDKSSQEYMKTKSSKYNFQVVAVKDFNDAKKQIRQRIQLSDGSTSIITIVSEKIYKQMDGMRIPQFSVVEVSGNFTMNVVQNRTIFVFKEVPRLVYGNVKTQIGNPRDYDQAKLDPSYFDQQFDLKIPVETQSEDKENRDMNTPQNEPSEVCQPQDTVSSAKSEKEKDLNSQQIQSNQSMKNEEVNLDDQYTPIKSLNTFLYDWKIKARVTKKHPKKMWRNPKGQGTLLNVELIDSQGTQIQATFFNDCADKYNDILGQNKVYTFSNGGVKMANKKYTSINNDYQIIFDRNSKIVEVEDDIKIQVRGFCFVGIDQISKYEALRTIDVVGIVTVIGELTQIKLKTNGVQKDRRNVTIVDKSKIQIQVSLWGQNARLNGYEVGQTIAIRGARVSDYGGKTLNSGDEHSQLHIDLDHPKTQELKEWKESEDFQNATFDSLTVFLQPQKTNETGEDKQFTQNFDNFFLIEEVKDMVKNDTDETLGLGGYTSRQVQSKYFRVSGYVKKIFYDGDKIYYLSCP